MDTCVSSDDCLCPDCEELPENCSNIIRSNNDNCSCPICRGESETVKTYSNNISFVIIAYTDCHIKGQVYQETGSCPKTCQEPHRVCLPDASGCTCPNGQLIDEVKGSCVKPKECSSTEINAIIAVTLIFI